MRKFFPRYNLLIAENAVNQHTLIKQVIDFCDYYILVIGDRYGSINEKTGKSYTEMEYDYALSNNIPILVFAKNVDLDKVTTDENVATRAKLKEFRNRALKSRMGGMWNDIGDLTGKVAVSIMQEIQKNNRPGWVRNLGFDPEDVSNQLNSLKDQVITLEKENKELKEKGLAENWELDLSKYHATLHFTEMMLIITSNSPPPREFDATYTLEDIFRTISVRLSGRIDDKALGSAIEALKPGYFVDTQQIYVLKSQFISLGLLEEKSDKDGTYVKLTDLGKQEKMRLNAPTF